MEGDSHPFGFVLGGDVWYLIWTEDPDGYANDVVQVDGDRVLVAESYEELGQLARSLGLVLQAPSHDERLLDLDAVAAWVESEDDDPEPSLALSAWNIFGDVARSLGAPFEDRGPDQEAVYDKVFFGNNLPAMTPAGEHYEPEWSESELKTIRSTLRRGLSIFVSAVRTRT